MDLMTLTSNPDLVKIGLLILFLAAAWITLRFIFRLARRVLVGGCGLIMLLGIALVILRVMK